MIAATGHGQAATAIGAQTQTVDTPLVSGGGAGGILNEQKDSKEAQTAAQFGDVWKNIQGKYGAKAEKPREIKKTLGKDDFLRIMVTQMKHQDPTSPFKAEQFATEMAQFTSVEQLQNMNQNLTKLTTQDKPLERLAMTNLIGKTVTIDRDRFPYTEGTNATLNYVLPKNAAAVHVAVVSEQGEVILEKDLGPTKQGENVFAWDGLKKNTLAAKGGNYMFRVDAKDENGQSMPINNKGDARVVGVSYDGAEPVFLVGDAAHPDKVLMRNIVKIVDGAPAALIPGAQSLAAATGQAPASAAPSFISFQKGVGSGNLDPNQLSPEAKEALTQFQAQQQAQLAQQNLQAKAEVNAGAVGNNNAATAPRTQAQASNLMKQALSAAGHQSVAGMDSEKGFPNGLHDQ